MIEAGDPIAVKLFEENNKIPMPPNALSEDQIRDILLYIENGGKLAEGEVAAATETAPAEAQGDVSAEDEFLVELQRDDSRHL